MATKKKKNAFVRYFTPFGLKQVCDITILLAAIMVILGLSLFSYTVVLLPIGLGLFLIGALMALYMSVKVMISATNRRSPEFKQALVNTVIMGVMAAISIIALFWFFFEQI